MAIWSGIVVAYLVLLGGVAWRGAIEAQKYWEGQESVLAAAQEKLEGLYDDFEGEIPRKNIEVGEIEAIEEALDDVRAAHYDETKAVILAKTQALRAMIEVRDEIEQYMQSGAVKAEAKSEDLDATGQKLAELDEAYQAVLQQDYDEVRRQYQAMKDFEQAVAGMFTSADMKVVTPKLTRATYRAVVEQANKLPQREVAEKYTETLQRVDQVLTQREKEAEEARRRAIEARRRAEELRRKQKAEEAAAWKVLNVPYHSQNLQKIYNGCEAASMLMGLQYKGYLGGVDLHKYAEMMPKSDNYNTGFVGSIYDLQPKSYVHWIAPAPLAKFGRESSGNAKVADISGASLSGLDKEVVAGNPVVIYVTFLFTPAKGWLNGAPGNLHVVLLTGYNTKTGAQRLTDPWTQAGGGRTYDLSKAELEKIYNAVGKRAVVIR